MHVNDDEFVRFDGVRVMSSTGPALLCGIGDKVVWLPRRHISGNLWCIGDRGELLIRRWVARDRHLIAAHAEDPISKLGDVTSQRGPRKLHLVRRDEGRSCAS